MPKEGLWRRTLARTLFTRHRGRLARSLIQRLFAEGFFRWLRVSQPRRVGHWSRGSAAYTLSFDCDSQADTDSLDEVRRILAGHGLRACFACVGRLVERSPAEHGKLVEDGHEIVNHTFSHPNSEELGVVERFNELPREAMAAEIVRAHESVRRELDVLPCGFRAPHFGELHTQRVYPILQDLGYIYSSSTSDLDDAGGGAPRTVDSLVEIPLAGSPRHPFVIFDSWASSTGPAPLYPEPEAFLGAFKLSLDIASETGAYLTHYFDPADVVRCGKLAEMAAALASRRESIEVLTYDEVVRRVLGEANPDGRGKRPPAPAEA